MKKSIIIVMVSVIAIFSMGFPVQSEAEVIPGTHLVAESSSLAGLDAGALFPFIDTTPNQIFRAHIAVTDATTSCAAGAAPPSNIEVLAGTAGPDLVNVLTADTNTGIGSPTQCVFHVTVTQKGVPNNDFTDIVVVNKGKKALTGINTITVSAEVQ